MTLTKLDYYKRMLETNAGHSYKGHGGKFLKETGLIRKGCYRCQIIMMIAFLEYKKYTGKRSWNMRARSHWYQIHSGL